MVTDNTSAEKILRRPNRCRKAARRILPALVGAAFLSGSPSGLHLAWASSTASTGAAELKTVTIPVEGMSCIACAAQIRRTVRAIDGVSSAEVVFATRSVRVTYAPDRLSPDRVASAINALGYRAGLPAEAR